MSHLSFAASLRHAAGLCRCRDHALQAVGHETSEERSHEWSGQVAPATVGRPFTFVGTTRKYERDRPFLIEHIALEIKLDVPNKAIDAEARLNIRRLAKDETVLRLDAIDFTIKSVKVDGKSSNYSYDDAVLAISIPKGTSFVVAIEYHAEPKRGLYFIAPDDHVQDRPTEVWSQCQDEDARAFFPCHDKPHIKQTTELKVHVPKGWFALGNGVLVDQHDEDNVSVFHWKQDQPHASYLVTLATGRFETISAEGPRGLPVHYHVPIGKREHGIRAFERTPAMIALFEERLGVKYPWAKYDQIVVHDFIFGGMENTSATTMYEHILLDARAALDVDMDGIVAHELGHQWFGDYVTCRDWSEGWLNEGWATYLELIWREAGAGGGALGFGRDEYDYAIKGELDIYLSEDSGRYRRPIVCRDYEAPIDLFDRHLYQKGALVLHAIRRSIGDDAFFAGTRQYLERHAFGSVESRDFQRSLEAASGRSLDRIFDMYVHGSGHPAFEATLDHEGSDGKPGWINISLRQTQKLDQETRAYEGPLVIEIGEAKGTRRETVQVRSTGESIVLRCDSRPQYVALDPDGDLLATFEVKAPADWVRAQLAHGSSARLRWLAAGLLAKRDDPRSIEALADTLGRKSEFWAVQAEAAEALGECRGERALQGLLANANTPDPKVRRAVVRALGRFKSPKPVQTLTTLALGDSSYLVAGEAARALGQTRQSSVFDTLIELLDRPAWADSIRAGAADGLGALRDDRAVPHLTSRTTYGHPSPGRRACMLALARLEPSRKTRELLEERLEDVDVFVRMAAARALETLGDTKARSALAHRIGREPSPMAKRRMREALRDIGSPATDSRKLREELDKVRDESHELRGRLSRLEAKLAEKAEPDDSHLRSAKSTSKRTTKLPAKKAATKARRS